MRGDAWPDVRDADELHDALLTLVALPEPNAESGAARADGNVAVGSLASPLQENLARSIPQWGALFAELAAQRRATRALLRGRAYWVPAERAKLFGQVFGGAEFAAAPPDVGEGAASQEDALFALLSGWMAHAGPTTAAELSAVLGLPVSEIDKGLLRLEANGSVLRGQFTDAARQADSHQTEWCDHRLLARIHRLTVG